jgi:SAM-dependent methyltransferase
LAPDATPPGFPGGPPRNQPPVSGPPVIMQIPVASAMSLVHVGSSDSFAITKEGREAASLLFQALEEKDPAKAKEKARQASAIYDQIIPRENYGGEYTALQWFANYFTADDSAKPDFLKDPQVKFFFSVFGGDDYAVLKEYLRRKYRIGGDIGDEETRAGQDRKAWLEDTILFNNPRRETWENTSEIVRLLGLKPGEKIADVGAGPGYYSFRFADKIGPTGTVYAIDTVAEHLAYIERAKTAMGVKNVLTIQTDGRTLGLGADQKVDAVFLCSLYHNIYAMATQPERDSLVQAIKDALNDDGTLYLADNGLVEPGILPYHGPYVAKELIIAQMLNYGFDLVAQHQPIPQRYLLEFKKRKPDAAHSQAPEPHRAL